MRTSHRIWLASLLATALLFAAASAGAHGGLPVSQSIMWRGDTMVVPTPYWGLFLGTDSGPWRWICDEAINANQLRLISMSSDGQTLYATDVTGLTISADGGCSWLPVSEPLAKLDVVSVLADPVVPKRAYVLANNSADSTQTGLWRSVDGGKTWDLIRGLGTDLPGGLAISADGQSVAFTSLSQSQPRTATLYLSKDAGVGFTSRTLTLPLMGMPVTNLTPLWFDPATPSPGTTLYLRTILDDSAQLLLRYDGTGDPVTALRSPSALLAMARDPETSTLLVATAGGLYAQQADKSFQPNPVLMSVQCLSPHNGKLYLCAWNYPPDSAAIARLQVSSSQLTRLFQYNQVQGPIDCPATTKVGSLCPKLWTSYASQLGVDLGPPDMAGEAPPATGSCQFGGAAAGSAGAAGAGALVTMAAMLLGLRRRAGKQRRSALSYRS